LFQPGYAGVMSGPIASALIARSLAEARAPLAIAAMALVAIVAAMDSAWPQAVKPPAVSSQSDPAAAPASPIAPERAAPQPGEPAPPAAARPENPGLFNEIGKLFDNRSSVFPSLPALKSPQETIDDFNARAKDAADGLSRLTTPLIVRGRMVCPVSANGAPDCKAASDKLCQTKGFKEGKSLDTDQAQSCSAAALLSGGNREPGNCRTNNYVTRALCQ
jgi:hypothetical protein